MCKIKSNSWKIHYGYGKCLKCGETSLDDLTWHHRNKSSKLFVPSKKTCKMGALDKIYDERQSRNWQYIRAELRKCDLLCRWCHNLLHKLEDRALAKAARFKKAKRNQTRWERIREQNERFTLLLQEAEHKRQVHCTVPL